MGEVNVPIVVVNPRSGVRSEPITVVADTGATLTVVPGSVLEGLGVEKAHRASFVFGDGRRASRDVGNAVVEVDGEATVCRIVFGESEDAAVLGLTALEQLGLAVDPVQRRLVSADFRL
jgi:predicted aspartyl protease